MPIREMEEENNFINFRFMMAKLHYRKDQLIEMLVDCGDVVSSKQLEKMTIREIYFTYKDACWAWIEESII